MLVHTKAIVISSLKYQDKNLIVKCFTETDGLKSYFVRNAFSSKPGSRKTAYFQPLNILDVQAVHKNKGTLENFKEVGMSAHYISVNTDVVKSTMAIFLSEMLHNSIREEEKNPELFLYLESALLWFDHHENFANFHLIVLVQLTRFFGFYPHKSKDNATYFDLVDGVFSDEPSYNSLSPEKTILLEKLLNLNLDSTELVFSSAQRRELLQIIIDYYSLHLDGFRKPKSLEILQQIFA